jgi:hypothetical protein
MDVRVRPARPKSLPNLGQLWVVQDTTAVLFNLGPPVGSRFYPNGHIRRPFLGLDARVGDALRVSYCIYTISVWRYLGRIRGLG